ncbi:MAG: sigma-70 family RNA polymerase sigma factor [Chitinophagaceae bacterium]|nr:sigma-70 family RNA polymerase sigma factor [Chitinophagaceae bacterium]
MISSAGHEQDKTMFDSFQRGEERGLYYYHRIHWRCLVRYCLRITGDSMAAEDIATDIFSNLHKRRLKIESEVHLKNSLYFSARNACIDHLRRNKISDIAVSELLHLNEDVHVDFAITKADLLEWVYGQFVKLPGRQKEVMELLYIEEMPYEEVAEKMQCSIQNVRNQRGFAIANLKKMLGNTEFILLLMVLYPFTNTGDEAPAPSYYNITEKKLKMFYPGLVKN